MFKVYDNWCGNDMFLGKNDFILMGLVWIFFKLFTNVFISMQNTAIDIVLYDRKKISVCTYEDIVQSIFSFGTFE